MSSPLYCSFCLKSEKEVEHLVAGHGRIFICGECVDMCNAYISGHASKVVAQPPSDALPTERLLAQLRPIEEMVQGKSNQLQWVVETLRSREVSCARIGAALGISRQFAWERFS